MNPSSQRLFLLGVPLDTYSQQDVLDKIKEYLSSPPSFRHFVSVNPENVVVAQTDKAYMKVCKDADLALCDGVGVLLAMRLSGQPLPGRVPGSKLLPSVLDLAGAISSTVLLIGSQTNLANTIAQCYSRAYPKAKFIGIEGYKNKEKPTPEEELALSNIVRTTRPRIVFVSFGSPFQEKWIDTHKSLFRDSICMGVGGAFNYLGGLSQQAPELVSRFGLEWLYRLVKEPWRMGRQLSRLPLFVLLVLKDRFSCIMQHGNGKPSASRT